MTAGYSGAPLAKKLGFKPGQRAWFESVPESVAEEIGETGIALMPAPEAPIDAAHLFVKERAVLAERLATLMPLLAPSGFIWVSWPKKASKVPTDITEDVIRDICLPMQLVDVKVCAVDPVWSGLKLMIRKSAR
jgi:hypothetical protein